VRAGRSITRDLECEATQAALSSRRFRVYTNTDVIGVEIAGAIKNVMAIATGAVNGLGLGYNRRCASSLVVWRK
jgi:glycerol-3-phosphate dehydrogenase (NAD(P)+)